MIRWILLVIYLIPCAVWALSTNYLNISDSMLVSIESRHGPDARHRVSDWRDLLRSMSDDKAMIDMAKMAQSNDFFNAIPWVFDPEHWGKEDYWSTPIEMLATNGGDCEDFSIGKYFSLTNTGVDCEDFSIGKYFSLTNTGVEKAKLRITYVKALEYNLAHMVLAYYSTPGAEPLILDNINQTILPASRRNDLLPVYSFNGDGLWSARARSQGIKGNPMKSLPQWKKMHDRIDKEWK